MARIRRSGDLGSRDAREGLRGRREPYFMVIERGLSLGLPKDGRRRLLAGASIRPCSPPPQRSSPGHG